MLQPIFALGLGGQEIWIIAILVLVLFGGAKIPSLMRSLGQGVGEFQKGVHETKKTLEGLKSDTLEEPMDTPSVTPPKV